MLLGIDIGTTKVACVVMDDDKQLVVTSRNHNAYTVFDKVHAMQDADIIINETIQCIRDIDVEILSRITHIGISCQMHGLLLVDKNGKAVSPLYTWQDKGTTINDAKFLSSVSKSAIYTGYGCGTLYSLKKNNNIPYDAHQAVTIGDYLNMSLFDANPAIDPANASSWGFYNHENSCWDTNGLHNTGIPIKLLPPILPFNSEICKTVSGLFSANIPVAVATGDNQASIAAGISDVESEIYLTLGTGGQLSVIVNKIPGGLPEDCEVRPFPGNKHVICSATLNGGDTWQWLASSFKRIISDATGNEISNDETFRMMNEKGLTAKDHIVISPLIFAERNSQKNELVFKDITDSLNIGTLSASFAKGLITNLRNMMPENLLNDKKYIVASGNAMRKNPLFQQATNEIFGLTVKISELIEEAATGAAIFCKFS